MSPVSAVTLVNCFGDGQVFDGYFTNVLFSAFGTSSAFSIDQVGYY